MAAIRLTVCVMVTGAGIFPAISRAGDAAAPPEPPAAIELPRSIGLGQVAEEPLEPFVPKNPVTEEERARQKAVTWFLTGQLREGRDDYAGAMTAYRNAIAVAPGELKPYQSLVTISFAQGNRDEATKYAILAAHQSREGVALARGLAGLLIRTSETQRAIDLLEEVRKSPPEDMRPVDELVLHRELGLFNRLVLKTDQAVEHYRKVMSALEDPDSPLSDEERDLLLGDAGKTYEEMGKVFLDAKLADLAVKAFDKASEFSKAVPAIHSFNLATVYKETGRADKALEELQKYFDAQLQSKGREAYQLLADLLKDLERSDELLGRLEELHDRDARNKTLSYFLAEQYEQQGHLDEAESLLTETIGRSHDPRGLVGLASVYRRQHKAKPLLETFTKAFQLLERFLTQADDPEVVARMDSDTRAVIDRYRELETEIAEDEQAMDGLIAYGHELLAEDEPKLEFVQSYLLGKLSAEAERIDAAKEFYQLAIDMQNDPPPQLFKELGLALTTADRYKEASEVFQQMLEHTSPRLQAAGVRIEILWLQSHTLEMDGQTDAALEAIAEARKTLPDNPLLHFQEAWIPYHAHRWDDATAKFEEVIDAYKDSDAPGAAKAVRDSRFSLSAVYVQQGNFEKGEEVLLVVLEQEPDHPQVNNDLGYLWADEGKNLEQARGMIAKALATEPDNPAYIDSMGWVLFQLGEFEKAREHFEKAVELERGQDSTIWDHLGDTYDKLSRPEKALDAWRKALELEQEKPHPDEKILSRIKAKLPAEAAAGDPGN